MNILYDRIALREITKNEKKYFIEQYEMTPEDFMTEYSDDWTPDDLNNKYVVSIEQNCNKPNEKDIGAGIYCFKIQGIYTPRYDQTATLMYCGHIAFVDVKNKDTNKSIVLLYKDDECYPKDFKDWYEHEYGKDGCEKWSDGVVPTKQEFIDVVELLVKANCQNPKLELNIKEEDIIMLQGL